MLTQRQRKILSILERYQENVTSEEIARLVGVSSKTVRTDIKNMIADLPENIAKIQISTRKGYSIQVVNKNAFSKLLNKDNVAIDGEARIKYIILHLLQATLNNQTIKQQDLADELYIGLSTLKISLKEVKAKLAKYDLDIINYKNQGMSISGNEAKIRYCISEYIFSEDTEKNNTLTFYQELFPEFDLAKVEDILIKVISSYELVFADTALQNLLPHVLIAIRRANQEHNVIYSLRESKDIEQHQEFLIARAIFEEIYNQLKIDVATSEIYYLAQHLIASKKYINTDNNDKYNVYIKDLVNEMLAKVNTVVGIDFTKDNNLAKWLRIHLEAVIPRIRFQMNIRNDMLEVIKNEYPLAFQIGVIASKVIEQKEQLKINENEIGFIAIHFGAALVRMDIKMDRVTKSAIVVCGGGVGTAVLLKAKLKEYFKDLINIIKIVPKNQLKQEDFNSVDFIFSTIPLDLTMKEHKIQNKIILVRNLLNDKEIEFIQHKIFNIANIKDTSIEKFFHRDCFIVHKQLETKEKILDFLTNDLINKGLIDERTAQSVFERETTSPTEIGNLVAIPHPMVNNTVISSISVLVLDKPIMWVDHHVQVVFLISIAKSEFYLWEPIFLKLFKYLVKENGVKKMINNPDYDEFIKDFKKKFE